MLALRSNSVSDPDNGCAESLTNPCKVATQSGTLVIQSGDTVYNIDNSPFDGNNLYYKIQLSLATEADPFYICLVNNVGNINVHTLCL
jgi:hypothetical protein